MLKWLNDKLSRGFYFPCMIKAVSLLEKASLNYWAKKHIREKIARSKKSPPWVSELYQCLFLVLGFLAFIYSEWINFKLTSILIMVFFYRIFEILNFCLVWIFATEKEVPLHSYRRSIAGWSLVNRCVKGI